MKLIIVLKANRFRFCLTSLLQLKPSRCYDTGSDLGRESPALTVPENGSTMRHPITVT